MNKELMEKIAKTRLRKEFKKRPDDIANYLKSRGASLALGNAATVQAIRNDIGIPDEMKGRLKDPLKEILMAEVDRISGHGKTLDDIKAESKIRLANSKTKSELHPVTKFAQISEWIKNNPGKSTAIAAAPVVLATTAVLANKAYQKRKALNQNEEANKTASTDYEEMVKMAYEDILSGFDKFAEEDNIEEAEARENKKKKMRRIAATSAIVTIPVGAVAAYKYNHRPGKYYPETTAFRKAARKAMKGKPIEYWNDKVEIVMPGGSAKPAKPILTPLLSASNHRLLSAVN